MVVDEVELEAWIREEERRPADGGRTSAMRRSPLIGVRAAMEMRHPGQRRVRLVPMDRIPAQERSGT